MIRVDHVSKSFDSKKVLQGISLSFDPGQIYGIVGHNGAGKTTLFRCIAGLESFDGAIQADRVPLKNYLGFLQTEPYFFNKMTGKEYIRLLCFARHHNIENIEDKNIFDLPLDQYASTYSTGMKKKLALTAILLQPNDYYILDEPYNGVDIQSNIIITEVLHRLRALNKTVILSSHIFSTLEDTCDKIFVLDQGVITKEVNQSDFKLLEEEMKQFSIGDKLDMLGLK